jgi:hypothetical protein
MDDLSVLFFRAISAGMYAFLFYFFWQILSTIWVTYKPMLATGKLKFVEIASILAGIMLFFALIATLPYMFLTVTLDSLDRFMGVGLERTNHIVNDMQGVFNGEPPIYIKTENTTVLSTPNPNNQTFVVPGQDAGGGNPYGGDPNAGGGVGNLVYATPTPFNPGTWNPSDPPPTPMVTRTVP